MEKMLLWAVDADTHDVKALQTEGNILKVVICGIQDDGTIKPVHVDASGNIVLST